MSNIEQSENQEEQNLNSADPLSYNYSQKAFVNMMTVGPLNLTDDYLPKSRYKNSEEAFERFFSLTRPEILPILDIDHYATLADYSSGLEEAKDNYQKRVEATTRVFTLGGTLSSIIDDNTLLVNLYKRLESTGLLYLASFAYEISELGKKRLQNVYITQKSLDYHIDPAVDTEWLTLLSQVVYNLQADPISFSIINHYLPGLMTFVFDALAVTGDYSNAGKGGGKEDTLNREEDAIDELEKAFGLAPNGEPIFTMAFRIGGNTSERIRKAIEDFPYRAHIPPKKPDIFHLRLGAANFYVPPISITVNSAFKTGSLTGGAIRQRNTPKYNAGYKETSISLRLFFPNYEEIWGMHISDASAIDLKENFKIDFKNTGDSEEKIDKFLSSLRGLVAAFKYSPILPIKNDYINSVHGISAVALSSMSVSTVPNYPFSLMVDLELLAYNHKPFLPMLKDFNQAIHWGKYRQYMGKAAGAMHKYANESFLLKTSDNKNVQETEDNTGIIRSDSYIYQKNPHGPILIDESALVDSSLTDDTVELLNTYENDVLYTNIVAQWRDGSNLTFYTPAETQTKMFLPDTSSFRSEQEKILNQQSFGLWNGLLAKFGIEISPNTPAIRDLDQIKSLSLEPTFPPSIKTAVRQSVDIITAGINQSDYRAGIYKYKVQSFISSNILKLTTQEKEWLLNYLTPDQMPFDVDYFTLYPTEGSYILNDPVFNNKNNSVSLNFIKKSIWDSVYSSGNIIETLIVEEIEKRKVLGTETAVPDEKKIRQQVTDAFLLSLYDRFFSDGYIQNLMEAKRLREGDYHFQEWEVPMNRVDLDPKKAIVNGVSVSLGNNLSKLQVQMQEEPTYQYIGGKDSYVNISMTVFGERELYKIRAIFDHINSLARLEHSTGVIGFLGIKNIISALCGIKYVIPLNFKVDTIPNYPHVYNVQLSFVDFDIFQQKREKLSSKQQKDFIDHFGSKRNPFLRIKQLWGAFNAYPDMPLEVRDKENEIVGNLDPDFYFRSFEMFDRDVINNFTYQPDITKDFKFDYSDNWAKLGDARGIEIRKNQVKNRITDFLRRYAYKDIANEPLPQLLRANNNKILIDEIIDYVNSSGISVHNFISLFQEVVQAETSEFQTSEKQALLTDYVFISAQSTEDNPVFEEISGAGYSVGNVNYSSAETLNLIKQVLTNSHLATETEVSFNPDEVDFHKVIYLIPATNPQEAGSGSDIPAMMQSALGTHFGYINKDNGRFYLTVDGANVLIDDHGDKRLVENQVEDTQTPDRGCKNALTGVEGVQSLNKYQKAYDGSFGSHIQKMMNDVQYRDISGRMIRAFPTYMLWLIDEGGFFAGVKLFDNFYGLQSIVDFSVVSSEDLLGDTLIFRVSNMYSKLTTRPSTEIFNSRDNQPNDAPIDFTQGIESILDRTLNIAKNIVSGMRNDYVVDINNIRLKPGVRVHLRVGYGANPNSLQTVFNGVITNVEQGEIVTVTAQSDAIELSAIVNSTNKKGDTGKIDGGVDTGMYLSEPRDLMVRLLSMGASRFREAFARATNGTVFSENRFGIRHFGSTLYEPLSESERARADGIRNVVASVYSNLGQGDVGGAANAASFKLATNVFTRNPVSTFFGDGRIMTSMGQLMSNFCAEVDLEIFKRNIYPGNGTGFAQFLGGDIDDGWLTASSLVEEDSKKLKGQAYLERAGDRSWNRLIVEAQNESVSAKTAISTMTAGNQLVSSEGRANATKNILMGGLAGAVGLIPGVNFAIGSGIAGGGLFGILRGRGGTNLFRTMGIISPNDDDDLPGFDEVSFRAQTYMRTVWDLFQVCARLLPNYIVAIRPFEDRSTIFYGKPHWLYTSGVVPVTTGFPSTQRGSELELPGYPKYRSADEDIQNIMSNINRSSNTLADYEAFKRSNELSDTMASLASDQVNSQGIYKPTAFLKEKLINFNSPLASSFSETQDDGTKVVVAKLPTVVGLTRVGFHLPVGDPTTTIAPMTKAHAQLDNLPPRFRYPFYTINETIILDSTSYSIRDGGVFQNAASHFKDIGKSGRKFLDNEGEVPMDAEEFQGFVNEAMAEDRRSFGGATFMANMFTLLQYESKFILNNELTLVPSSGILELDRPLGFSTFIDNIIDVDGLSFIGGANTKYVRMPLPSVLANRLSISVDPAAITQYSVSSSEAKRNADDYSFEYEISNQISYEEWGSPGDLPASQQTAAEAEQFYIAMKWPYNPGFSSTQAPSGFNNITVYDETLEKFKEKYGFTDLYGTAEDYKKRKVLVYSPRTNRAVVCAPAYFLWGDDDDTAAAVVSPDAAWYLGNFISKNLSFKLTANSEESDILNQLPSWINTMASAAGAVGSAAGTALGYALNVSQYISAPIYIGNRITDRLNVSIFGNEDELNYENESGLSINPQPVECMFAFVPDDVPVGVISSAAAPIKRFLERGARSPDDSMILGFGNYTMTEDGQLSELTARRTTSQDLINELQGGAGSRFKVYDEDMVDPPNIFSEWIPINAEISSSRFDFGGNALAVPDGRDKPFIGYFNALLDATNFNSSAESGGLGSSEDSDLVGNEQLSRSYLYDVLDEELSTTGDVKTSKGRAAFLSVYDPLDSVSVEARSYYDENFDPNVSVIAGNGRNLNQANDIWDQFRFGYHTYDSVKAIFARIYGMDPDSTDAFPEEFARILGSSNENSFSNFEDSNIPIAGLSNTENTAVDELAILLGADYFNIPNNPQMGGQGVPSTNATQRRNAVEFIRKNYIDLIAAEKESDTGIIQFFNATIADALNGIKENFFESGVTNSILEYALENKKNPEEAIALSEKIKTPKQLFLLMVGIFRQNLWSTAYGRAWLVLKPNRKRGIITSGGGGSEGQWSFKPVDKIFEAFINPYGEYAKDKNKFLKLLVSTKSEGTGSSTFISGISESVGNFYDRNIGPIMSAIGDGLSGLLGMFKLAMMQMGYAITEVGNFSRQAHILNKVLNDSIYYSLGREGSLLRAVDNPFTREYGEPVVEVRQSFQRLHYLSSFSHIISNQIQENLNGVSTVVTAVSDGKYPITVALDKGAPAERQTEKTVETGLYYDNFVGSGFLGVLRTLMHPLETVRGIAKNIQGTPDELSARRIALAHLRESIKDIYGGELIIIGNADIRPHDLVYLSDVYERMYGIFEVEQIVHHFTPEMGYITSITPNALVTVNDPARWFLSSWINSWFTVQNLRNDTRFYMDNIMASNSGINLGGMVSVDALSDALSPQMIGGLQYTHGSTALIKDIMANQTATTLPQKAEAVIKQYGSSASRSVFQGMTTALTGGVGIAAAAAGAGATGVAGFAMGLSVPIVGQLAWKGWKWIRDNVLDQHGCYVQYLSKNGQPMDAGLSYNQGMVVGRHHSKVLLPGLLGARTKVRTPEGNIFIRSDDLLKSLGWQERQTTDLIRYIDYENALVHARVLQLSGLGPDKTNLQPSLFSVIAKVIKFKDGDTFDVQDVISGAKFTVRFDGIDSGEINTFTVTSNDGDLGVSYSNDSTPSTKMTAINTPGGKAKIFVQSKLENRLVVLRIRINNAASSSVISESDFEAGAEQNTVANYTKDVTESNRILGTVWYYQPESIVQAAKDFVEKCFIDNQIGAGAEQKIKQLFFNSIYQDSPLFVKKDSILNALSALGLVYTSPLSITLDTNTKYGLSNSETIKLYNDLVQYKVLESTYNKTREWPTIFWDEYYENGHPVTLNWELVTNNLATVYTKQLQIEGNSVISAEESAIMPARVGQ